MNIPNLTRMGDGTLASRIVAAKREAAAAQALVDALSAEAVRRGWEDSVEADGGRVTVVPASERVALDGDKAKVLIPDWRESCAKVSTVRASVRVTFR